MAVLSSSTLISSIAIFNIICAYYLVTTPAVITSHNIVTVLSAAVNLPVGNWRVASDAVGLLAAVLALLAISDLGAVSMREEVAAFYWRSQSTLRLAFFFALSIYSYSRRPGGLWAGREESLNLSTLAKGTPSGLGSGIVFAWAFVETISWFWVFLTLRDERREREISIERRAAN